MAERGYFSHEDSEGNDFADRYAECGYECHVYTGDGYYHTGGKNIAYTSFDQPIRTDSGEVVQHTTERELADDIVDQWMTPTITARISSPNTGTTRESRSTIKFVIL